MAADPRLARAVDPRRTATPPQPPPPPPPTQLEQKPLGSYDGVDDGNPGNEPRKEEENFKLKFCTVCASNNNRYVDDYCSLPVKSAICCHVGRTREILVYTS
jgi:RNA polymerase II subunit A C-terminal domain phosphatase SSU72